MHKQQDLFGNDMNVYTAKDEKPNCRKCTHKGSKMCASCHKTENMSYYERHKSIYLEEKEMKLLLFKPTEGKLIPVKMNSFHNSTDRLTFYYKILECRLIEIPEIRFDQKVFSVICSENVPEGTPLGLAVNYGTGTKIRGNILITKYNEDGDAIGLSDEDIKYITRASNTVIHFQTKMYMLNVFQPERNR